MVTDPGGAESKNDVRRHVRRGAEHLRPFGEGHGFEGEGREGGETTEDAHEKEEPGCRRQHTAELGETAEKPEQKAGLLRLAKTRYSFPP